MVARQQQHLRDHLRRPRVVVGERQEQPAAVLGVDRHDAQRAARLAVDHAAAQVDAVVRELAVDQDVIALETDVVEPQQLARLDLRKARGVVNRGLTLIPARNRADTREMMLLRIAKIVTGLGFAAGLAALFGWRH